MEWRPRGVRRIRVEELLYQSEDAVLSAVGTKAGSEVNSGTGELATSFQRDSGLPLVGVLRPQHR